MTDQTVLKASRHSLPSGGFQETLEIQLEGCCYPFHLGTDVQDAIVQGLLDLKADRYIVITDPAVASRYGENLVARVSAHTPAACQLFEGGEGNKRLSAVEDLAERALAAGATRASCIVAMGGGVAGNVAGMVAALLFRGIQFAHVPTTLISLLDSVLSLKQAVNASSGKNLLGTYYAPACVLGDTRYLDTLPAEHMRSGLCEVIKNALAIDPSSIPYLHEHLAPDGQVPHEVLREIVRGSVRAKLEVMRDDKRERRSGLVLEYGHTVGHAIELESGKLSHGESIGLGMLVAAQIGYDLSLLSAEDRDIHRELLAQVNAPLRLPEGVYAEAVLERVRYDNKRGLLNSGQESFPMVLLRGLGRPIKTGSLPLHKVSLDIIARALDCVA